MNYTTVDGDWNQSAIMTRGHEIARSLDENRDYRERLSAGLTQAWTEAKEEASEPDVTVHTTASDWSSPEPDDGKDEGEESGRQVNIHMHVMDCNDPDGPDKIAMTTTEAIERLERIPNVEAIYHDDGTWTVETSWRGQELVSRRVDTFQQALNAVIQDVAPAATRSMMLDDVAEEMGEWWVKTELNMAKMEATMGQ